MSEEQQITETDEVTTALVVYKKVLRNDMKNKLNSGEVEISAESKEQLLKEL